jgi:hypothetical protein
MASKKPVPRRDEPSGDAAGEDDRSASPSLRAQFDLISDTAAQQFPSVIRAIEKKARIPQHERDWIAEQLIGAACIYRLRTEAAKVNLTPAQQRQEFRRAADSAKRLLEILGIEDPALLASGWPSADELTRKGAPITARFRDGGLGQLGLLLPAMQAVAEERRGEPSPLSVVDRAKFLLIFLSDLVAAASRLADDLQRNAPRGRGGARRQIDARGSLIICIIETYAEVRKRCPESGPKPGFGGPMVKFIRSCLEVVGTRRLSDVAIRGYFERWHSAYRDDSTNQ